MPACAVSNGLFIGEVPLELRGLSVVEERLIAPLRVAANIVSIRPLDRKNPGGAKTRRLTSHVVTFPNSSIDSITQGLDNLRPVILPNRLEDLADVVNVVLLKGKGSSLPISRSELVAQLRSVLVARRNVCNLAIRELKQIRLTGRFVLLTKPNQASHQFFSCSRYLDAIIDRVRIGEIPESEIPVCHPTFEQFTTFNIYLQIYFIFSFGCFVLGMFVSNDFTGK